MAKMHSRTLLFVLTLLRVGRLHAQSSSCNGTVPWIGDGFCDIENNNVECDYDGGDCCMCTCVTEEFSCGIDSEFLCRDPNAGILALDCASSRPEVVRCSRRAQRKKWVVEDNAGAGALAEAVNCSGGTFDVEWRGDVHVSGTVHVTAGTMLNVTGDAEAVADGRGIGRIFTVVDASLHVSNLHMQNGFGLMGGAIFASNSDVTMDCVVFDGNSASYGGAVFAYGSSVSWSGDTAFSGNRATPSGGALFAHNSSSISWSGNAEFTANTATRGGAIYGSDQSKAWWTGETVFAFNSAGEDGGVIFLEHESGVSWDGGAHFVNNRATGNGGVFSEQNNSTVSWTGETRFANNSAYESGGVFFLWDASSVWWDGEAVFYENSAHFDGGVISLSDGSSVSWSGNTEFANNIAGFQGGALALKLDYLSQLALVGGTTIFSNNTCGGDGGAIFLSGSDEYSIALEGNISFSGNSAGVAGGALAVSSVGAGPQFEGVDFFGNSAQVGGAVYLLASGTKFEASDTSEEKSTTFIGCTFNGNRAVASGGAIDSSSGYDEFYNTSFVGNGARRGGALRLAGWATLVNCSFKDNYSDEGEGPAVSNIGVIDIMANCSFADNAFSCPESTFLDTSEGNRVQEACDGCGECQGCSVDDNRSVAVCEPQYEHSTSSGGYTTLETLRLDSGYWRTSEASRNILACYNTDACLGGAASHEYCKEGYAGPYCSVCTEGFVATLAHECTKCSSDDVGIVVSVIVAAVMVAVGSALVRSMVSRNQEDSRWRAATHFGQRTPRQSLKIVVVAWQIVTQFSSIANVRYPELYQRFLDSIDVINFNLEWVFAASCVVEVDFHHRLFLSTLGPVACMCLLGVTYNIAVRRNRGSREALETVFQKHVSAVALLTFLVYSSVSATVFQMFACDGLDDGKVYLRADYRIECDSTKHQWLQVYAAFMIVVYPVGIPLVYMFGLFRFRGVLGDNDKRTHDSRVQPISELWKPYRPDRFYYEVVECGRRIMLTGVVVFIFPDTAAQIAVTILIGVGFIFLSEGLAPYESNWDVWVSRTGHAVVFLSMFVALLLKVDVSDERQASQNVFAGILVAAHLCMVLTVVVEAVTMACALRRNEDQLPTSRALGVASLTPVETGSDVEPT